MSDKRKNVYNPKEVESRYYNIWEERGYFEVDGNSDIQKSGENFAIMMPPPNVTGHLHIGHALTFTLQDIIVRYKRMQGFKTLWQPGVDHAGIATQNVVEKQLLSRGKNKRGDWKRGVSKALLEAEGELPKCHHKTAKRAWSKSCLE